MGLGYLTSYEGMGRVRVECADGCSCQPVTLDAHTRATISPSNPSPKPDPKPEPNADTDSNPNRNPNPNPKPKPKPKTDPSPNPNQSKISPYDLHYLTVHTQGTTAAADEANAADAPSAATATAAPARVAARRLGALGARKEGLRARRGARAGALRPRRSPRLLRAGREAAVTESGVGAPAPPSHCALRLTVRAPDPHT